MGLDGVELVIAFEESFGIKLEDSEAAAAVTPAMVIDLIFAKLKQTDAKTCQSQRAFYLLRRAAMSLAGMERRDIRPDTALREIIPSQDAKRGWEDLRGAVGARSWPQLEPPRWLTRSIGGLGLAIMIILPIVAICFGGIRPLDGVTWGVLAALLVLFIGNRFAKPFRFAIPQRLTTLRDLTPFVATSDEIAWTRQLVADKVKAIVIHQLGLKESDYFESANFVKDLGLS